MGSFKAEAATRYEEELVMKWKALEDCRSARDIRDRLGFGDTDAAQAVLLFSARHRDQARTLKLLDDYEIAAQDVFVAAASLDASLGVDYYVKELMAYFPDLVMLARREQTVSTQDYSLSELSFGSQSGDRAVAVPCYPEGERLNGRYVLGRVIGIGGHSTVYDATDLVTGASVAVKSVDGRDSDRIVHREVSALQRQLHPSVVRMLGSGKDAVGRHFIVLDLYDCTLARLLPRSGLGDVGAVSVALAAAEAVRAVHATGMVHGDVKPHNILLKDGVSGLVLTDFSVAMDVASALVSRDRCGTVGYVCPEAFAGEPRDRRADVFSLGMLLYRLLVGVDAVPHRIVKQKGSAYVNFVKDDSWRLSEEGSPAASVRVARVVNRATAFAPDRRFGCAEEFIEALSELGADASINIRQLLDARRAQEVTSRDFVHERLSVAERSIWIGEIREAVATVVEVQRECSTVNDSGVRQRISDVGHRALMRVSQHGRDAKLAWDIARLFDSIGDASRAAEAARLVERLGCKGAGISPQRIQEFLAARS
jgi:hypothetical protein